MIQMETSPFRTKTLLVRLVFHSVLQTSPLSTISALEWFQEIVFAFAFFIP